MLQSNRLASASLLLYKTTFLTGTENNLPVDCIVNERTDRTIDQQ